MGAGLNGAAHERLVELMTDAGVASVRSVLYPGARHELLNETAEVTLHCLHSGVALYRLA
jgi:alpha-beta hydrolase superfamily lysophospholipase